jgi:hypothetical protein
MLEQALTMRQRVTSIFTAISLRPLRTITMPLEVSKSKFYVELRSFFFDTIVTFCVLTNCL